MPSSRSAKEMCQQHGEESISCKVAQKKEARRKRKEEEYGSSDAPKPDAKKPEKKKEKAAEKQGATRRKYIDDRIREAEGK